MASGHDESFDMFASRPSFTDRFSRIASERSHIDPVEVYAAFVIGISERAIETSAAIAYADRDEEKTPTAQGVMREMGDALKYVIRSLETASDEWVAETVDYVLEGLEMDTDEDDGDDEGGEDDRVRIPSSIRSSSAGVRRSERTSLGLTVLCSPSSAAPSFSARTWGSEGDPRVLPGALCSLLRVLFRSGAASEAEFLHLRGFALRLAVYSPLAPEAPTFALRA
jgi:hypothetical protein